MRVTVPFFYTDLSDLDFLQKMSERRQTGAEDQWTRVSLSLLTVNVLTLKDKESRKVAKNQMRLGISPDGVIGLMVPGRVKAISQQILKGEFLFACMQVGHRQKIARRWLARLIDADRVTRSTRSTRLTL